MTTGSGYPAKHPHIDQGGEGEHGHGQPTKNRGRRCCRGAELGFPQRTAPVLVASNDLIGQPVGRADSSKQGAFQKDRAPPQHRFARPALHHTRAAAGHSGQPSPTASERGRAAWHSLGHRTEPAPHGEATAIGRCGSQVYRVSVQSRGMAAYGELATSGRRREWGAGSAVMS